MAPARGYIELELSLTSLNICSQLQPGQVMQLAAKSGKSGKPRNKKIQIRTERKEDSVSLKLLCSTMGPGFNKISQQWICAVHDENEVKNGHKYLKKSKFVTEKDNLVCDEINGALEKRQTYNTRRGRLLQAIVSDVENVSAEQVTVEDGGIDHLDYNPVKEEVHATSEHGEGDMMTSGDVEIATPNTVTTEGDTDYNEKTDEYNDMDFDYNDDGIKQTAVEQSSELLPVVKKNVSKKSDKHVDIPCQLQCRFCCKSFPIYPNRPMMPLQQHETKFCKRNPWSHTSLEPKPTVSDKFPVKCIYCPKAFKSEKFSKVHEVICARNPEYVAKFDMELLMICDICNHMCSNKLGLAYHRTKTHGCPSSAQPRKYPKAAPCPCRFCGTMMSSRSTRFFHERFKCSENPNVSSGVRCRFCSRLCAEAELEAHIEKHHTGAEHHICEICGRVYDGRHKLYQHRLLHKEIQPPSHKCPHCDKVYMLKGRLQIHMAKHTNERNIPCTICGKYFKNKHQENKHRVQVHENRYRYRCTKCGHGMAKQVYLENHKCGRVRRKQGNDKGVDAPVLPANGTDIPEQSTLVLDATTSQPNTSLLEKPVISITESPDIRVMPEVPGSDRTTELMGSEPMPLPPSYHLYNPGPEASYVLQHLQRYPPQEHVLPQQPFSLQYFTS